MRESVRAKWEPTASRAAIERRAQMLDTTRRFFRKRGVIEVETPLLSRRGVTDPFIESFSVEGERVLITSPEFAMKRLLAAGMGSIYQICKAFRKGEAGARHNPEFTMLEWYRVGFTLDQLIDEVDALLQELVDTSVAERLKFGDVFEDVLGCDPHTTDVAALSRLAEARGLEVVGQLNRREDWIRLLSAACIEPVIANERPVFLSDFPVEMACLARIGPAEGRREPVAHRFEVYYRGLELANGFHELVDGDEHERRFASDTKMRREAGRSEPEWDTDLLAAIRSGLPDCSGVAIGFDRLVMLALDAERIRDVLSFDWNHA